MTSATLQRWAAFIAATEVPDLISAIYRNELLTDEQLEQVRQAINKAEAKIDDILKSGGIAPHATMFNVDRHGMPYINPRIKPIFGEQVVPYEDRKSE